MNTVCMREKERQRERERESIILSEVFPDDGIPYTLLNFTSGKIIKRINDLYELSLNQQPQV